MIQATAASIDGDDDHLQPLHVHTVQRIYVHVYMRKSKAYTTIFKLICVKRERKTESSISYLATSFSFANSNNHKMLNAQTDDRNEWWPDAYYIQSTRSWAYIDCVEIARIRIENYRELFLVYFSALIIAQIVKDVEVKESHIEKASNMVQ